MSSKQKLKGMAAIYCEGFYLFCDYSWPGRGNEGHWVVEGTPKEQTLPKKGTKMK